MDDITCGPAVIALNWSLAAIAGVVVALRFWARSLRNSIGADDWFMLATWVSQICLRNVYKPRIEIDNKF